MRQVLVQRMILPSGSTANQSYDVLKAKNIENALENSDINSVQQNSSTESHASLASPASYDLSASEAITEVSTKVPLQYNAPTSSNSSPFTSITNNSYSENGATVGLEPVVRLDNNNSTSTAYKMTDVTSNNTNPVGRFFQSSDIDNADISLTSSFPDSAFDESTSELLYYKFISTFLYFLLEDVKGVKLG